MNNNLKIALNTPWKLLNELLMYLINPFVIVYLRVVCRVKIGKRAKFYGFPRVYRHRGSSIVIGDNFECRSWMFSNPLGINHPTILCTWDKDSSIQIGNDVGISGGAIVSSSKITIGNRVLVGANSTIIDSDFHPTEAGNKRYKKDNVKKKEVSIGEDSFIGMGAIILKGVLLPKDSIVSAGSVVRKGNEVVNFSTSRNK